MGAVLDCFKGNSQESKSVGNVGTPGKYQNSNEKLQNQDSSGPQVSKESRSQVSDTQNSSEATKSSDSHSKHQKMNTSRDSKSSNPADSSSTPDQQKNSESQESSASIPKEELTSKNDSGDPKTNTVEDSKSPSAEESSAPDQQENSESQESSPSVSLSSKKDNSKFNDLQIANEESKIEIDSEGPNINNSQDSKTLGNLDASGENQNSDENLLNQDSSPCDNNLSSKESSSQVSDLQNSSVATKSSDSNFEPQEINTSKDFKSSNPAERSSTPDHQKKSESQESNASTPKEEPTSKNHSGDSKTNDSLCQETPTNMENPTGEFSHLNDTKAQSKNEEITDPAHDQSSNEGVLTNPVNETPKTDSNTATQNAHPSNKEFEDGRSNAEISDEIQKTNVQITKPKETDSNNNLNETTVSQLNEVTTNAEKPAKIHNHEIDDKKQVVCEKNSENEKENTIALSEEEKHSQQVTETVLEPNKEKPLPILDVHEYFRNDLDLSTLDCLSPIERIDKISSYAKTFESQVKEFKEEKYSLEYFILDEKLMQLIEKLDKIKYHNDSEITKKKIEAIRNIKELHTILDECAK